MKDSHKNSSLKLIKNDLKLLALMAKPAADKSGSKKPEVNGCINGAQEVFKFADNRPA